MDTKHTSTNWSKSADTMRAGDYDIHAELNGDPVGLWVATVNGCQTDAATTEANAALITAAPKMYEAILYTLGGLPNDDDLVDGRARAEMDKIRKRLTSVMKTLII